MLHTCKGPYLLAETWASGQENGRDLLETREEQQLAKQQEMAAVNLPLNAAAGAK
jgi:hypothetical protein